MVTIPKKGLIRCLQIHNMKDKRYIDLLVDFAFKKIFGTDSGKTLLIDLLNAVFENRKVIIDLVYNKSEHHGDNEEEGSAVFDLLSSNSFTAPPNTLI